MSASENKFPPTVLMAADLPVLPPLELTWIQSEVSLPGDSRPDGLLGLRYREDARIFLFEYKSRWDARTLDTAVRQVRRYAEDSPDAFPLVILPYLSSDHLNTLLEAQVSGLDLCGNALIVAQGRGTDPDWLLRYTGQANRFRQSGTLTTPYLGKAALVARTLLAEPVFATAGVLQAEMEKRGGQVSQPVVSRALRALQDDLVVSVTKGEGIEVIQPAKLLDRLVEGWKTYADRPANREERLLWRGRISVPTSNLSTSQAMNAMLSEQVVQHQRMVMTGLGSAVKWTNLSSGEMQSFYVDAVGELLKGYRVEETRRFPNLELWRPPDEAVYFDVFKDYYGRWASPVQTYLEMVTGDARTQDAAQALRASILGQLESRKTKTLNGDRQPWN